MASAVRQSLGSIIEVGRREKWLVDTTSVDFMPHSSLYVGVFSCIALARFHGTRIAVKVPRVSGKGVSADKLPSIVNSLRAFQQLKHPNICLFYGVCIDTINSELSLLIQMAKDTPLDKFVLSCQAPLCDEGRFEIISGMCSALRYLSDQSPCIVHGELQPSKFLIDRSMGLPCARLVDCGWSRLVRPRPKHPAESVRWVAPELVRAPGSMPTKQADVFSFGRLSYFVVSGHVPLYKLNQHTMLALLQMSSVSGMFPLDWVDVVSSSMALACRAVIDSCASENSERRPDFTAVHEDIYKLRRNMGLITEAQVRYMCWSDGLACVRAASRASVPVAANASDIFSTASL